ncbi:MAG: cyclodeaminase/cyclohydrolase family protein [Oscillospiraceae bacterium]|jgi:formiminotetrahydrofolate cyclodeaminase
MTGSFDFADMKISDYLEELASSSPAPGGGAAAGISGAQGMALASMVCEVSSGNSKMAESKDALMNEASEAKKLMKEFLELAGADASAYAGVMSAMSLPKSTQEEKAARTAALQDAMKKAAEAPLSMMRACLRGLEICGEIARAGYSRSIKSDLTAAARCLSAAAGCAEGNVYANTAYIKDEAFKKKAEGEAAELKSSIAEKASEITG